MTTYAVPYPFVRSTWSDMGAPDVECWKPGIRFESNGVGDGYDDFADAMGVMYLTIVSIHKPGKFPERVFYTRQWKDPDGKVFGKSRCLIATRQKFNRLLRGYAHDFELQEALA